MIRKYYRETILAIGIIIFFDCVRLFYTITIGEYNLFDFLWLVLLIFILFFNIKAYKVDNKIHQIISSILGIIPLFFIFIGLIQIISTGLVLEFNFVFMIFEAILILVTNCINFYEFYKYLKTKDENINNE